MSRLPAHLLAFQALTLEDQADELRRLVDGLPGGLAIRVGLFLDKLEQRDLNSAHVQEQVQLSLRRLTELHPDPLTAAVLLMTSLTAEELEEAGGMPEGNTLEEL